MPHRDLLALENHIQVILLISCNSTMLALDPATRGRCRQTVAELLGCNVHYAFELALLTICGALPLLLSCCRLQPGAMLNSLL